MATVLTVLEGKSERQGTFTEHPTELARQALLAAADVETPHLAAALRRVAAALPDRPRAMKARS
jgi:hypothetical protein